MDRYSSSDISRDREAFVRRLELRIERYARRRRRKYLLRVFVLFLVLVAGVYISFALIDAVLPYLIPPTL